jgi:hypothetical protein
MIVEVFPNEFKKYIKQSRNSFISGYGYTIQTKSGFLVFDFYDSPYKKCTLKVKRQSGNGVLNFIHANDLKSHSILTRSEFSIDFDISAAKIIEVRRNPISTGDVSISSIFLSDENNSTQEGSQHYNVRDSVINFPQPQNKKTESNTSVIESHGKKVTDIISNFKDFSYSGHKHINTFEGLMWYQYNKNVNVENFSISDLYRMVCTKNMFVLFDPSFISIQSTPMELGEQRISALKKCSNLFVSSEAVCNRLGMMGIKSKVESLIIPYVPPSNASSFIVPKDKKYVLVFGHNENVLNDIKSLGYHSVVIGRGSSNENVTMVSEYIELPDLISLIDKSEFVLDFVFDLFDKKSPYIELATAMGKNVCANSWAYMDLINYSSNNRVTSLEKQDEVPRIEEYVAKHNEFINSII